MRKEFFKQLNNFMTKDEKIWAITGDLGYGGFNEIMINFPERFLNCGAAEFSMLGVACGLAINNKISVVYSIGTFLIYRPFEIIRTYINHENIPIKLISSGRDKDYSNEGISHWMHDIKPHLDLFSNIKQYWPKNKKDIDDKFMEEFLYNNKPCFLSLVR